MTDPRTITLARALTLLDDVARIGAKKEAGPDFINQAIGAGMTVATKCLRESFIALAELEAVTNPQPLSPIAEDVHER